MLFVSMVFMFTLSTIYWVLSVVVTFLVIKARVSTVTGDPNPGPATRPESSWLTMFNAILLVNVSAKCCLSVPSLRDLTTLTNIFG
jgi:hypothetical protein